MIILPKKISRLIKRKQKCELTEYYVYKNIAHKLKNENDKAILNEITEKEKAHYEFWTSILGKKAKPSYLKLVWYKFLTILFGYTFTLKIMEKGEIISDNNYEIIFNYIDEAREIADDERELEFQLLTLLKEDRLNYVGSMILGLNDALVELTGAIAGLTFALSNTKLISLSALITGVAASLSMAASEFLSSKAENKVNAVKSATYTGIAYIITVTILVLPYLLISDNKFLSLGIMLASVVLIIFLFNYYISVSRGEPFKKRFFQMVFISLSVALISFFIGFLIKTIFGIDI